MASSPSSGVRTQSPLRIQTQLSLHFGSLRGRSPLVSASRSGSPRGGGRDHALTVSSSPRPPSPFRNVFEQPVAHSRESRLLSMLHDFSTHVFTPQAAKVHDILMKVARMNYLSDADEAHLRIAHGRNDGFMTNAERCLGDAVTHGESMDRSAVQRCHVQWTQCMQQNERIDVVLRGIDKAVRTRSPNRAGMAAASRTLMPPHAAASTAAEHRSPSSADIAAAAASPSSKSTAAPESPGRQLMLLSKKETEAAGTPLNKHLSLTRSITDDNLDQTPALAFDHLDSRGLRDRRRQQQLARSSPARTMHTAALNGSARSAALARLALRGKAFLKPDDVKEAQAIFFRHCGIEEGRSQFMLWLAELPVDTLRALQAQLS